MIARLGDHANAVAIDPDNTARDVGWICFEREQCGDAFVPAVGDQCVEDDFGQRRTSWEVLPTGRCGQVAGSTRDKDRAARAMASIGSSSSRARRTTRESTCPSGVRPRSFAAAAVGERSLHVAVGVALGDVLPAVVALASLGEGELDLGPAFLEVEGEGHQREPLLCDPGAEAVDLSPVGEELAGRSVTWALNPAACS